MVSGPSGAGKGTLIRGVLARFPLLAAAISATTRTMRVGEVDGREYHFLTDESFEALVHEGAFVEHVTYAGNRYGTLVSELHRITGDGRSVIVEIELQGARFVREASPDCVLVFIAPPSMEELARRLRARATDSAAEIATRLEVGEQEVAAMDEFDHRIVNHDVQHATAELIAVIAHETGDTPQG